MSDAAASALSAPQAAGQASGPLIVATGINKSFHDVDREILVLQDLSLTVQPGELIAVVGQSGTGKSTLLNILGSLERPSSGKVLFEGLDLFALDERRAGGISQSQSRLRLPVPLSAGGFQRAGKRDDAGSDRARPEREAHERASGCLRWSGSADKLHRRPAELSGGEQQRVAVARAVVQSPRLVLADEPTGNLDPHTADEVHELFHKLNRELDVTLIVATHNERLTRSMGRALRLKDGKLFDEPRA